MLSLQQLAEYLENYLECANFEDHCRNGIQVEGKGEIARLATGVTASLETIRAAANWRADVLVVHHGLFWSRETVALTGPMREKVALLLDAGISLLAYHLPLDAHRELGNNWVAARDLGLQDLMPFGLGVRGTFDNLPLDEWIARVESYYGQKGRMALAGPTTLSSAAIISGGAHRELSAAAELGLDGFISGTGDEPNWHTAHEKGIHFLAMGHAATERVGPRALRQHLEDRFGLETTFLEDANVF